MSTPATIALLIVDGTDPAETPQPVSHLNLPLLDAGTDPVKITDYDALLILGSNGLSLQRTGPAAPGPVSVDFGSAGMRHRRGAGHNELLGRAVGVGRKQALRVLDATAGLGRDSFVLADLGCEVLMSEREPLVAAMLQSGMDRARASGDPWLQDVLGRMSLWEGDARALPPDRLETIDVVCLDPMFPGRNKSAAVKKEMALFQLLLQNSKNDTDELLHWALALEVARVVVKRPARAGHLAGRQPSHVIEGKSVRYDVYVKHKLS